MNLRAEREAGAAAPGSLVAAPMSSYPLAKRVYWRLLRVPGFGRLAGRLGDRAKETVQELVEERLGPVRDTVDLHTSAVAGLRDAVIDFREAIDALQDGEGGLRSVHGMLEVERAARVRLEEALAAGLAALQERSARIESELASESHGALGRLTSRLDGVETRSRATESRVEFVRQETLFELRAAIKGGGTSSSVQPEVVNAAKLGAMVASGHLRLNVGCGHLTEEGYVNVDSRRLPDVDVIADVAAMQFEPGSVAELYSSHLLEHFPIEQLRRVVLPHWLRLLRPGGVLRAIVPDADGMLAAHAAGELSFEELREVTFGLQEYDGDFHYNMFSRDGLRQLLESVGLVDVTYAFTGRRNGHCLDMEIRAAKPGA